MKTLQKTISNYSTIFHKKFADDHHIVSPLGAWMLLALLSQGSDKTTDPLNPLVEKALGVTSEQAQDILRELVATDHLAVFSAMKAWIDPKSLSAGGSLEAWLNAVNEYCSVDVKIPNNSELDSWVSEKSLNLIQEFPVTINPDSFRGLFATVLATDVEWEVPLKVIPDNELAALWDTPNFLLDSDSSHTFIHRDRQHGLFGVHYAKSVKGLTVYSVIAFDDIPNSITTKVAHEIATGRYNQVALDDLRDNEFLSVKVVSSSTGAQDRFQSILPAWEFSGEHDLSTLPECGLSAAASRLGEPGDIKQIVVADYSAKGFKAAALTYALVGRSAALGSAAKALHADLLFTKPYAVVAVAVASDESIWNGLPAFSGVVSKARNITRDK